MGPLPVDPATVAGDRESVRLAFVAALQHLPARQRAALILRDVADLPADEVATALGTTTVAVNSALLRARERIAREAPDPSAMSDPESPEIKTRLRTLLLGLQQLGFSGKSVIKARLRRLLDCFCRVQRALSYHHFLPRRAELVKAVGHIKDDFLVRSIEADIRHHQFLPRCCPDRAALAEVDQQPFCVQLGPRQQRLGD